MPYLDKWVSEMLTASDLLSRDALPGKRGSPYTTVQSSPHTRPGARTSRGRKVEHSTMLTIGGKSETRPTLPNGKIKYKNINDGSLLHPGLDYNSKNLTLSSHVDFFSDEIIHSAGTDYYRVIRKSGNFNDGMRAEEMANLVRRWERKAAYDGDFILDDFMEED